MSDQPRDDEAFNGGLFNENYNRFPAEEILRHAGQFVAWNMDATAILGADEDELELVEQLRRSGIDPSKVVIEYVFPSDVMGIL